MVTKAKKPKPFQMNVRMTQVDQKRVEHLATVREITPAQTVRTLIKEEFERCGFEFVEGQVAP
jgi:hypothetical protein